MALYHKHRPQTWASVIGQDTATTTIQNQIKTDSPAHAYLLSGPRGVGKTTTARLIAKSLNCERRQAGESEPCNECSQCVDITRGAALDVIEIDAASNTGVDTVREVIIENAQFQPTKSKYKVFIVDEVHMLSTSAFNALLKTLEEPPAKTIFILATTEIQKLPATILSRCQRYAFKKIPRELMAKRLSEIVAAEGVKASEEIIHRLVRASEGSARDAVSLLDQIIAASGAEITEENLATIIPTTSLLRLMNLAEVMSKREPATSLEHVRGLVTEGVSITQLLADLVGFWRGLLLYHYTPALALAELDAGPSQESEIKNLVAAFKPADLLFLIEATNKHYLESRTALIPELPLELLVIEASGVARSTPTPVTVASPTPPPTKTEPKPEPTKAETIPPTPTTKVEPVLAEKITTPEPNPVPEPTTVEPVVIGKLISKAEVEKVWPDFIRTLETNSPSVVFLLKGASLGEVNNNVLNLTVNYDFHRDKLSERTTKKNLEDLLSSKVGSRLAMEIQVVPAAEPTAALNDLAAAFGGEVV